VTRIGNRLVKLRREAWERWYEPVASARWGSAAWHTVAEADFLVVFARYTIQIGSSGDATTRQH